MHRVLWLSALFALLVLPMAGCLGGDDDDDKSPTGPDNEMVDETPDPAEENNDEIQLEGAFTAVLNINGTTAKVTCPTGNKYGLSGSNTVTFNTLNHSDACSGDSGTFLSILNFPPVTSEGLSGAADVIVQAESVRNLVLASAGAQVNLTVESWDAATKHLKARLDITWDNGNTAVALFDMDFN